MAGKRFPFGHRFLSLQSLGLWPSPGLSSPNTAGASARGESHALPWSGGARVEAVKPRGAGGQDAARARTRGFGSRHPVSASDLRLQPRELVCCPVWTVGLELAPPRCGTCVSWDMCNLPTPRPALPVPPQASPSGAHCPSYGGSPVSCSCAGRTHALAEALREAGSGGGRGAPSWGSCWWL